MKVKVDRTKCDGFGTCAAYAPKIFYLDEWGYAAVAESGDVPPEEQPCAEKAFMECPADAIMLVHEDDPQDTES